MRKTTPHTRTRTQEWARGAGVKPLNYGGDAVCRRERQEAESSLRR